MAVLFIFSVKIFFFFYWQLLFCFELHLRRFQSTLFNNTKQIIQYNSAVSCWVYWLNFDIKEKKMLVETTTWELKVFWSDKRPKCSGIKSYVSVLFQWKKNFQEKDVTWTIKKKKTYEFRIFTWQISWSFLPTSSLSFAIKSEQKKNIKRKKSR